VRGFRQAVELASQRGHRVAVVSPGVRKTASASGADHGRPLLPVADDDDGTATVLQQLSRHASHDVGAQPGDAM